MRHYSALRNVQANRDFDCRGRFNTSKRASPCQHPVPVFSFHLPISFSRTLANVSRAHRRRCMLQEHGGANLREILLLAAQRSTLSGTAPGPLIPNASRPFFPFLFLSIGVGGRAAFVSLSRMRHGSFECAGVQDRTFEALVGVCMLLGERHVWLVMS